MNIIHFYTMILFPDLEVQPNWLFYRVLVDRQSVCLIPIAINFQTMFLNTYAT